MKLCLVTGASGFVGGHIAERLLHEGWKVRTVVRPSSRQDLLKQWGVELVEGDLTDDAITVERHAGNFPIPTGIACGHPTEPLGGAR